MSHKNNIHGIDVVSHQPAHPINHHRLFLFALSVALLVALVGITTSYRSTTSSISTTSSENAAPYSDALAMQYAQPWLDAQKHTAVIPYSDALAMQYAQPWLDAQKRTAVIPYSDALAMQYAQPWLDSQKGEPDTRIEYSNALAMMYAQPWLDQQKVTGCNGRLDLFYACQHGYRPPED